MGDFTWNLPGVSFRQSSRRVMGSPPMATSVARAAQAVLARREIHSLTLGGVGVGAGSSGSSSPRRFHRFGASALVRLCLPHGRHSGRRGRLRHPPRATWEGAAPSRERVPRCLFSRFDASVLGRRCSSHDGHQGRATSLVERVGLNPVVGRVLLRTRTARSRSWLAREGVPSPEPGWSWVWSSAEPARLWV